MEDEEVKEHDGPTGRKMKTTHGRKERPRVQCFEGQSSFKQASGHSDSSLDARSPTVQRRSGTPGRCALTLTPH